jgi:hypothetical protein
VHIAISFRHHDRRLLFTPPFLYSALFWRRLQLLLLVVLTPLTFKLQSMGFFGTDAHAEDSPGRGEGGGGHGDDDKNVPAGSLGEGLQCFFAPGEGKMLCFKIELELA